MSAGLLAQTGKIIVPRDYWNEKEGTVHPPEKAILYWHFRLSAQRHNLTDANPSEPQRPCGIFMVKEMGGVRDDFVDFIHCELMSVLQGNAVVNKFNLPHSPAEHAITLYDFKDVLQSLTNTPENELLVFNTIYSGAGKPWRQNVVQKFLDKKGFALQPLPQVSSKKRVHKTMGCFTTVVNKTVSTFRRVLMEGMRNKVGWKVVSKRPDRKDVSDEEVEMRTIGNKKFYVVYGTPTTGGTTGNQFVDGPMFHVLLTYHTQYSRARLHLLEIQVLILPVPLIQATTSAAVIPPTISSSSFEKGSQLSLLPLLPLQLPQSPRSLKRPQMSLHYQWAVLLEEEEMPQQ